MRNTPQILNYNLYCKLNIMKATTILFDSQYNPKGKVNLKQLDENSVEIHVYARDLKRGLHGFHVHKSGDLTKHCDSLCEHYNGSKDRKTDHGGRTGKHRHIGDLGNVKANKKGIVRETFVQPNLKLSKIIGRSLIIHDDEDDLGRGFGKESKTTGNSGKRVLCGVIGIASTCL